MEWTVEQATAYYAGLSGQRELSHMKAGRALMAEICRLTVDRDQWKERAKEPANTTLDTLRRMQAENDALREVVS